MEVGNALAPLPPLDQLKLTNEEKTKQHPCKIEAENPNVAKNLVKFNYLELKFVKREGTTHLAVHFDMPGTSVAHEDPAAKRQAEYQALIKSYEDKNDNKKTLSEFEKIALDSKDPPEQEEKEPPLYPETHKLKNQFSFSARATQTYLNPLRDRGMSTFPAPRKSFKFQVTQWDIFDSYLAGNSCSLHMYSRSFVIELQAQNAARDAARDSGRSFGGGKDQDTPVEEEEIEEKPRGPYFNPAMRWASKLMERLVNMNSDAVSYNNFKYWEADVKSSDKERAQFKQLWTLHPETNQRLITNRTVTAISWNPIFTDLVAVGYGTYNFDMANQAASEPGLVQIFSLKNTRHPEYSFPTDAGVMSLDFHPQHPSLLCVGLYDGTVLVHDVMHPPADATPNFASTDPKTKHTDPVWEVSWQREAPEQNLNFFSVSSDGRVTNWILNKTELVPEEVAQLKPTPTDAPLDGEVQESADDDTLVGLCGGSCFDFNPHAGYDDTFVVGTEEGGLYLYSKAVGSSFLRSFQPHFSAIYTVKWNPFHPGIFLSCGADWTVKVWEYTNSEPVMSFDLGCAVADIAWCPFSSTVFAVGSSDRLMKVYDLSVDKHSPVNAEKVGGNNIADKKCELTHLEFNPEVPIISVGLTNGQVYIYKLSGSLELFRDIRDIDRKAQVLKLDDLLIINDEQGTAVGRDIREQEILEQKEAERKKAEAEAKKALGGD
jgi:dynein intermediate chain 1